jgi:hypothetical protein
VKLNVLERIMLLTCLPAEGNLVTLKIVRQLREALSFNEEEIKDLEIQVDENVTRWNSAKDGPDGNDIPIGEKATDLVVASLKKLDEQGKLTQQHISLCEKFNV